MVVVGEFLMEELLVFAAVEVVEGGDVFLVIGVVMGGGHGSGGVAAQPRLPPLGRCDRMRCRRVLPSPWFKVAEVAGGA